MKYKIIKEIHKYSSTNKIIFRIYDRFFFSWVKCEEFDTFKTYDEAEETLIDYITTKFGGIIKIDNNVYEFHQYSN